MSGFRFISVGRGTGTGELTVAGGGLHDPSVPISNSLTVGQDLGTGTLEVTGGVTGYMEVMIGQASLFTVGPGAATGTVTIHSGGLTGVGPGLMKCRFLRVLLCKR